MSPVILVEGSRQDYFSGFSPASIVRDLPSLAEKVGRRRPVVAEKSRVLRGIGPYSARLQRRHPLFVNQRVSVQERVLLQTAFSPVLDRTQLTALPFDELVEVLSSPNWRDHFIAGAVTSEAVVLYRGDLQPLVVPLDWFRAGIVKADVTDLQITDFGQTIRLGDYEVAADAILYDFDSDYRRRTRANTIGQDASFGGSLRRLRLQRGLRRSDFSGISDKEVARIERGEVGRPQRRTLARLAKTLGVGVADIESY